MFGQGFDPCKPAALKVRLGNRRKGWVETRRAEKPLESKTDTPADQLDERGRLRPHLSRGRRTSPVESLVVRGRGRCQASIWPGFQALVPTVEVARRTEVAHLKTG
jgi:hypothetical protein